MKIDNLARKIESELEPRKKLVFTSCPCCGSKDLIEFGVDTLCCHCDWDSCAMYVAEGLMDNRLLAFKELFDPRNKIVVKRDPKNNTVTQFNLKSKNDSDSSTSMEEAHNQFFTKIEGKL